MAKRKSACESSDREKNWDKFFSALVKLTHNLHEDRNVLEDRIKYLRDVIYEIMMELKFESAKAELLLGLKEWEAFIYKHRYEGVDDELADFREWFEYLSQKCSEPKDTSNDMRSEGQEQQNKMLREEVRRLKTEFEKCKSEKSSEISALLADKDFLWNQFKSMESQMDHKLRKKCDEVDHANEMVQVLVKRADELQLSNEKLRTDISKMESESFHKNLEISRLSKEIAVLKSSSRSTTPILLKCVARSRATEMGANTSSNDGKMTHIKPAAHKSAGGKAPRKQLNSKGSSSSKRKAVDVITISDSPKLFTSSFKVPKLKS